MLTGKPDFGRFCGRIELLAPGSAEPGEKPAEPANRVLRCLPKSDDAPFREVLVEINGKYQIVRVLVREPAGIETEFRFARWEENLPLQEVLFHIAIPPGVVIVEQSEIAGPIR
jgi:hypothetical protein